MSCFVYVCLYMCLYEDEDFLKCMLGMFEVVYMNDEFVCVCVFVIFVDKLLI